ncbi:MAG: NADH-quinone oxidoreductase subunit C [Syntrophomonadaceae bacterium]|nr:NADH-quinone oxidoreductase subunit C [Syntrophomonadaceae bacterium]
MQEFNLELMIKELEVLMGDKLRIGSDQFFAVLNIESNMLTVLMTKLRDEYGFNHLANLSSVDYGEEFELVYHLYSIPDNKKLLVKTRVPRTSAELDSLITIWPTADWQEREVYDLMGIKFKAHPNLIRVLLPEDFEGHPLRKDFVMGGRS